MTTAMLPAEFADLEPYARTWCLPTEPERWSQRLESSMEQMQGFYDACFPRAEEAIQYLDRFELEAMPPDAVHLLQLLHSFALVSYATEVWLQPLPADTGSAQLDRIREPSP